jgi:hypothetical protein
MLRGPYAAPVMLPNNGLVTSPHRISAAGPVKALAKSPRTSTILLSPKTNRFKIPKVLSL